MTKKTDRTRESPSARALDAPQAFLDFGGAYLQVASRFATMDDLIRFCLRAIRRDQLPDFIVFAGRVDRGEVKTTALATLWPRTDAHMIAVNDSMRPLMRRARAIAINEGGDGSLYARRLDGRTGASAELACLDIVLPPPASKGRKGR